MRSSLTAVLLLVVIGTMVSVLAAPQQSQPQAPTPAAMPPPLPTGPAPDLNLVFTAEVAGYVEPCG